MAKSSDKFRHESLQDADTIQEILKSITKGLGKGKLTFSDENGQIVLEPEGLLNLKVTANQEESLHRLDIRVSWQVEGGSKSKKALKVGVD